MHALLQEWKDLHEMQEYEIQEFDHCEVNFKTPNFKTPKIISRIGKGIVKVSNKTQGQFGTASNKWLDFSKVGDKGRLAIMKELFVYIQGELPNIDDEHITEMKEALSQINTKYEKKTIKDHWLETSGAKTENDWKEAGDTNRKQYMTAFIEKINTWFNGQVDNNVVTSLKDACIKMEMFKPKWIEIVLAYQK
jgi:hypothetical protein